MLKKKKKKPREKKEKKGKWKKRDDDEDDDDDDGNMKVRADPFIRGAKTEQKYVDSQIIVQLYCNMS